MPLCGLFGGAKVIIISETAKENTKNFRAGWFPVVLSSASLNDHADGCNNDSPNLRYHVLVSGMMSDVEADCIGGGVLPVEVAGLRL